MRALIDRLRSLVFPATRVVLFLFCLVGFLRARHDIVRVRDMVIAGVCLVGVLFSEEFSEFTGSYGWTRADWRQPSGDAVRWVATIALVVLAWRFMFM